MALDSDFDEEPIQHAMHLYPRHVSEEQMRRYEGYMAEIFTAFGLDLKTPATHETPGGICGPCLIQPKATRAIPNC